MSNRALLVLGLVAAGGLALVWIARREPAWIRYVTGGATPSWTEQPSASADAVLAALGLPSALYSSSPQSQANLRASLGFFSDVN